MFVLLYHNSTILYFYFLSKFVHCENKFSFSCIHTCRCLLPFPRYIIYVVQAERSIHVCFICSVKYSPKVQYMVLMQLVSEYPFNIVVSLYQFPYQSGQQLLLQKEKVIKELNLPCQNCST